MGDEFVEDVIYPPTSEEIEDLKSHNIGLAIRFASKLGRPLSDWEYDMFKRTPPDQPHSLVVLPGGGLGISG
ncbi:MAG: hypothetical protein LBM23_00590 [Propionibacteriaceae bacterium]|jgi:hypothetical protein|nr:hypothetical protein [Propionibacteriaceae bacterium]